LCSKSVVAITDKSVTFQLHYLIHNAKQYQAKKVSSVVPYGSLLRVTKDLIQRTVIINVSVGGSTMPGDRFLTVKKQNPVVVNAVPILGVKPKRGWYVYWLFFKIDLCSAISFKRSRRELSIDVAERKSMLKNNQTTHYPRFSTQVAFPRTGGLFFPCSFRG